MASSLSFVEFVVEQIAGAGDISFRKMFGEYGIYLDGKIVALVCDDRLFVKPTPEGRRFLGRVEEAPPYPGAKPSFLIGEEIEDAERLTELIRITAAALPAPAKKRRKTGAKKNPT